MQVAEAKAGELSLRLAHAFQIFPNAKALSVPVSHPSTLVRSSRGRPVSSPDFPPAPTLSLPPERYLCTLPEAKTRLPLRSGRYQLARKRDRPADSYHLHATVCRGHTSGRLGGHGAHVRSARACSRLLRPVTSSPWLGCCGRRWTSGEIGFGPHFGQIVGKQDDLVFRIAIRCSR